MAKSDDKTVEHMAWGAVILGTGSAAAAMLAGFNKVGIPVHAVAGRTKAAAKALLERVDVAECRAMDSFSSAAGMGNLVIMAVPDKAVSTVATELAKDGALTSSHLLVHLSGVLPASALDAALASGARIGSLHPLLSFTDNAEDTSFSGATFAVEGDPGVVEDLSAVARALGAVPVEVSSETKALYHAAAAIVSNFTVTIFDLGLHLFERIGVPSEPGAKGLTSLLESTVANIAATGTPDALTGPVARGDTSTVEGHLRALKDATPELLPLYAALGVRTIDVALRKGTLQEDDAEVMRMMFTRHL